MGACILCGKSAGLFYSLHKNCYQHYEDSRLKIAELLSKQLGDSQPSQLAKQISHHVEKCGFVAEANQRTLIRGLEYFVSDNVEINQLTAEQIHAWLEVLEILSPDESLFVDPYFLAQQYNLPALYQLNTQSLPDSNRHPANYSISLRDQETLWWCFDNSEIKRDEPVEQAQSWSIMMHIIKTILPKKHQASVRKASLGDGKLLITNQRIFFESQELVDELGYNDIYSVTPVKNGVRIQSRSASSTAKSYLCDDGRLLFNFIKHAQAQLNN